ncbi:uronyl 2-sulfotransferase-like [Ptychodera flava]|uniref:uronyl 2-sulfotransferase-like n=1 Tax=Ptychodera flava TaxID=63121 RepID=UPI00396A53F1
MALPSCRRCRSFITGTAFVITICVFLYAYSESSGQGEVNSIHHRVSLKQSSATDGAPDKSENIISRKMTAIHLIEDPENLKNVNSTKLEPENLIFYNKVGKCGSRTMVYLLRELARRNKFHATGDNMEPKMQRILPENEQKEIVERVSSLPQPATFYRHINFIDFERFGFENPTYINIVRRPLSRQVSYYYFRRFGDGKNSTKHFTRDTKYETFDDCVLRDRPECSTNNTFIIAQYFCGQHPLCRVPSRWAVERAKENVIKYYYFVGLTEEYDDTLKLLQLMLPRFFEGAFEMYKRGDSTRNTTSVLKRTPSPRVVAIMNERLALENEFYDFIRERFYQLKVKYNLTTTHK